jgi:hypothetical protein
LNGKGANKRNSPCPLEEWEKRLIGKGEEKGLMD